MSPQIKHNLVSNRNHHPDAIEALTNREKEIIILHMKGKNRKDIARILKVEVSTVDAHTKSIHLKTGTHDVTGVIRFGYDHRLDMQ